MADIQYRIYVASHTVGYSQKSQVDNSTAYKHYRELVILMCNYDGGPVKKLRNGIISFNFPNVKNPTYITCRPCRVFKTVICMVTLLFHNTKNTYFVQEVC